MYNSFIAILKIVFRRKTLNTAIFIIVAAIIREALALGYDDDIENLLIELNRKYENENSPIIYFLLKIIFTKGSWVTLSILTFLLIGIGFLKYKEINTSNDSTRPYLDLQLKSERNKPNQYNKGKSSKNPPGPPIPGKTIYHYEWLWRWQLIIRNNSERTAYHPTIQFKNSSNPFDYLSYYNYQNPMKKNDKIELDCNIRIEKEIKGDDAKPFRYAKFPPLYGIDNLEILVEYKDSDRNIYYTLMKVNNGKNTNEYLNRKPNGF